MYIHEYPQATRVFFETAKKELEKADIQDVCNRAGVAYNSHTQQYIIAFLGSEAKISTKDYSMEWNRPFFYYMFHITILHYLICADGSKPKGEWISLYDVAPTASTRIDHIMKANIPPLTQVFGKDIDLFFTCAEKLGGKKITEDTAEIWILPHIPVRITIWTQDDEFPADARILFDKTLHRQLYAEDIVYTADLAVRSLIGVSGKEYKF